MASVKEDLEETCLNEIKQSSWEKPFIPVSY